MVRLGSPDLPQTLPILARPVRFCLPVLTFHAILCHARTDWETVSIPGALMSQTYDPNAEFQAAQAAIQQGRHTDATVHLSRIIPDHASHPAIVGLLERLVTSAPDPLALVPPGPADYGTAAVHAFALGRVGRGAEAYGILRQLAPSSPANGIIDWALPWLDSGALDAAQRDEAVMLFFVSANARFSNRKELPPEPVAIIRRWLPHVQAMMSTRPYDDPYHTCYVPLLRQAGAMDEAIRVARARHQAVGDYSSGASLASTLREARDFDGFFAANKELLTIAPSDVPARLDMGDCYWEDLGKLDEAERWYAESVQLKPEHEWAWPSLLAVRYLRNRNPDDLERLEDYVDAQPQNQRGAVCLARVTPFFADFVYPADASINNMNQIAQQVEQALASGQGGPITGTIKLTLTGLETPSCQVSVDRQLQRWGGGVKLEREVRGMQSPDPREPRVPVHYRLWVHENLIARPAVEQPPPPVAEAIAALARSRYDLGTWAGHAVGIAERLGEANIPALLGVMAIPPDAPQGVRMWDWMARMQMATTLVIGALAEREGSAGRQVLIDLANGPLDWATAAAVVALTVLAQRDPRCAPEVRQLFAEVYQGLPRPGADFYENVLLNCRLRLPGVPAEERAAVRAERRTYIARTQERISDAELAARVFLSRPRPESVAEDDVARIVIGAFARNINRDHPGLRGALQGSLMFTDVHLASAEGDLREYFEEQARVLRLIQAEMFPGEAES
jgi:tetratricopeptide (TPR) repeat protein